MLPTDDKERKALPLWDFMFGYFPDAWLAVVDVAVQGNKQHNPGEKLHWARGKSMDQLNTAFRHQFDYGTGTKRDSDGVPHLAKAVWRLMAQLQLDIEAERSTPSYGELLNGGEPFAREDPKLVECKTHRLWHLPSVQCKACATEGKR